MATASTVFFSYAHGDQAYQDRVLAFADRLELLGIEVLIDRYEHNPIQGWNKWMVDGVHKSDYILCFCTEEYTKRFHDGNQPESGLGVHLEGTVLNNLLASQPNVSKKVQVIQFDKANVEAIPLLIRGNNRFTVKEPRLSDDQFKALYRVLTDQNVQRPKRGTVIDLNGINYSGFDDLEVLPAKERIDLASVNSDPPNLRPLISGNELQSPGKTHKDFKLRSVPGKGTYLQRLARKKLEAAWEASNDDRNVDAVHLIQEAQNLDGSLRQANALLCNVYYQMKQWAMVTATFEKRHNRGEPLTLLEQMRWHMARYHLKGDIGERSQIEQIVEDNEQDPIILSSYCYFLDHISERAAAQTLLRDRLQHTRDIHSLHALAVLDWRDGNVAEATNLLEEAAKLDGADTTTWANLGVGRAEMRRFGLAIEALRYALAQRPRFQFAHFALAEVYAMMGDAEAAIVPLRELVTNKYHGLSRLHTERTFDPIRSSTVFQDFLSSIPSKLLDLSSP